MSRVAELVFLVTAGILLCVLPAAAQQGLSTRLAVTSSNPNGAWSFGYIDDSGTYTSFNSKFSPCAGVVGWDMDDNPDAAGNVTFNTTSSGIEEFGIRWEPGQILLHPGGGKTGVAIRWTVPSNITLNLDGLLTGQHLGGDPAIIKLRKNGKDIVTARSSGFAGRGAARTGRAGDQPELRMLRSISVSRGDTLDLMVMRDGDSAVGHVGIDLSLRSSSQLGEADTEPVLQAAFPLTADSVFRRAEQLLHGSNFSALPVLPTELFSFVQQRAERG